MPESNITLYAEDSDAIFQVLCLHRMSIEERCPRLKRVIIVLVDENRQTFLPNIFIAAGSNRRVVAWVPPDCEFEYSAPVVKEIEVRLDGLLIPSSDDLSLPLVFLEAQMQAEFQRRLDLVEAILVNKFP